MRGHIVAAALIVTLAVAGRGRADDAHQVVLLWPEGAPGAAGSD